MTDSDIKQPPVIECKALSKSYQDGEQKIVVLKKLSLSIQQGEKVAIIGPSGSGKSTLLHLMGGLDTATDGTVLLQNKAFSDMNEFERCQYRNEQLGFVYQFHHLLAEFSALENVMMPLLINKNHSPAQAKQAAQTQLDEVGLGERFNHRPAQLSGGERQRVAIARAMVIKPLCILADEPTGNLDAQTASSVFDLLLELNQAANTALVIVTHDLSLAQKMDRQLTLQQGQLVP